MKKEELIKLAEFLHRHFSTETRKVFLQTYKEDPGLAEIRVESTLSAADTFGHVPACVDYFKISIEE